MALAIGLAELRSELEKAYRNTYYCAGILEQHVDGRITGKYCGNRWCLVCNRIRTARAMQDYLPVLQSWQDPHFVTLTIPNVPGDILASTIADLLTAITAIGRGISRTDGLTFHALRKLECTYNPRTGLYHPHFHLIVDGELVASRLIDRWLKKFPDARRIAQRMRPADEGSIKELFKYFTKLSVKTSSTERCRIPLRALDVIFQAMRKKRVYQSMGFTLPRPDDSAEEGPITTDSVTQAASRRGEYIRWEWSQLLRDWLDFGTGDLLSGGDPLQSCSQHSRKGIPAAPAITEDAETRTILVHPASQCERGKSLPEPEMSRSHRYYSGVSANRGQVRLESQTPPGSR